MPVARSPRRVSQSVALLLFGFAAAFIAACGGGQEDDSAQLCPLLTELPPDVTVDAQRAIVLKDPPQFAAASRYFTAIAEAAPEGAIRTALGRSADVFGNIAEASGGSASFDQADANDAVIAPLLELGQDPEVTRGFDELAAYATDTCGLTDGPVAWSAGR